MYREFEKVTKLCKDNGYHFSYSTQGNLAVFRLIKAGDDKAKDFDVLINKPDYISNFELDGRAALEIYRTLKEIDNVKGDVVSE